MSNQYIRIIRKTDLDKQRKAVLQADIDYQLATLHEAMQRGDHQEIRKCKTTLKELQDELKNI